MAILGRVALFGVLLVSHTPQHELAQEYRLPPEDQRIVDAATECMKQLDSLSPATRDRMLPNQLRQWLDTCMDRELRPKP